MYIYIYISSWLSFCVFLCSNFPSFLFSCVSCTPLSNSWIYMSGSLPTEFVSFNASFGFCIRHTCCLFVFDEVFWFRDKFCLVQPHNICLAFCSDKALNQTRLMSGVSVLFMLGGLSRAFSMLCLIGENYARNKKWEKQLPDNFRSYSDFLEVLGFSRKKRPHCGLAGAADCECDVWCSHVRNTLLPHSYIDHEAAMR